MSKMKFSSYQQRAINGYPNTNILVSAGAGSGKTTVMSERVTNLVGEGVPIDEFLVLTFTDAAANSMKKKIRKKIEESDNPQIKESLPKVDEAHIETFDAFALWLVKKYSYLLEINKDISIIDEGILKIKKDEIIDTTIDEYLGKSEEFKDLYTKYCFKDDSIVVAAVNSILDVSSSYANKEEFYESAKEKYQDETYITSLIRELVVFTIHQLNSILTKPHSSDFNIDITSEVSTLFSFIHDPTINYDTLKEYLERVDLKSLPRSNNEEEKQFRNYITNKLKELKSYFVYPSEREIIQQYLSHKNEAKLLLEVSHLVDERLSDFKREYNIYDFSDISSLANTLLMDDKYEIVRKEVSEMFTYIFVDEYQDTNDIQENVLNAIERNNLYMVGDIKQSIYRFRNADCEIFREKFNQYRNESGGKEIDLKDNFRSRPQLVTHVNETFSTLMNPLFMADSSDTPIDYRDDHDLVAGLEEYLTHEYTSDYGFNLYQYTYPKKKTDGSSESEGEVDPKIEEVGIKNRYEYEAHLIADDIINRVNKQEVIYDKESGDTRPINYSDFAILIRSSTHFDEIEKVFNERHIPLIVKKDEESYDYSFGKIIKNILKVIYYIVSDLPFDSEFYHAFASLYRSPAVGGNDEELYHIFKYQDPEEREEKIKSMNLFLKIAADKETIQSLSLSELMLYIYDNFSMMDCIFSLGSYNKNSLLWDKFVSNAVEMEKLNFTLMEYVKYFSDLDELKLSIDIPSEENIDSAVILSTIHKAKGLEYHTVYLPYLDTKMYYSPTKGVNIYVSKDKGLIFPWSQEDYFSKSLAQLLDEKDEKRADYFENLRLIYVALTRGIDRNILLLDKEKFTTPVIYPDESKNFGSLLYYSYSPSPYQNRSVTLSEEGIRGSKSYSSYDISFSEIQPTYHQVVEQRASKEVKINNPELLNEGTKVHYILEHLDFDHPDLSFLVGSESHYKAKIESILSLDIFKGVTNDMVHHEYEYYDEVNNLHGVIDCLIERSDHIDIIDFKLKNIEDEAYEKQVNAYRKYISTLSNKPINMYLLSINDIILKKVDICN
ncbi:MAG: UvrD-helicase domain-containing protein [Coprobacillus sp.]|nr:UvrD-helicase domain-containing protein [Coprobacillus sp.]